MVLLSAGWLNEKAVWRKVLSLNVFTSFPFACEGGIWGHFILVLDHCLIFYCITILMHNNGQTFNLLDFGRESGWFE